MVTRELPHPTRVATGPPRASNLPVQLTSFIGREAELTAVTGLLGRSRLVTLTGPGGAGKSRLAWQVASAEADRYPDGTWWVELAAVAEPEQVAEAVGSAIGLLVDRVRGPLRSVVTQLRDRDALVCLDNAEHLLDAVAELTDAVLRGCPKVTVLVTSREPLGLPGEIVWRVPPLADDDAIRLFTERARLVRSSFTLDETNEPAVRSIAAHLDGIPLALELAAAWLGTLSVQQVETGLDDRFRLLVRGPRGAQRRQQTLAGSIDWSHALLGEADRIVFRRFGVFAGTFTLDAARSVAAGAPLQEDEVLPALGRLVDKSLVMAEPDGDEARYRLLETIRAYATARLVEAKEDAAFRDRHLAWYLEFVTAASADRDRDPDAWRRMLLADYDNLRAALDWGLTRADPDAGRRLAASLDWLWHLDRRGREGMSWLRRAIAREPADRSRLQARLLTGLALVVDTADPLDLEFDAATRALDLATEVGDEGLRALCLNLAAVGAFYTDFDAAWEVCEDAWRAAQAGGNTFVLGGARALQAIILHLRDRHAEAEALVDETVRDHLRLHRGVLSTVLGFHASGAATTGDLPRARELAEEALRLAEPLGDYLRVGSARGTLAYVHALRGDLDAASAAIQPILRLLAGVDDAFVPGVARTMGVLSILGGDLEGAIAWLEREARSTDRGKETYLAAQAKPALGAALAATGRLPEATAALEQAVAVATRLGMPGPLAEALDGQAELAASEPEGLTRAIDLDHDALALRVDHGLRAFLPDSLEALARHGAAIRPTADDARVLAASESARAAMGVARAPYRQVALDAAVAGLRGALGDAAFDEAWTEGRRLTLDDAVAYVRRARGSRGRPSVGWASLTPAELEVVRLVADGLSNPEIASRLFMSRSTVKTHLAHVFAKLDVANRTELAASATSHASLRTGGKSA